MLGKRGKRACRNLLKYCTYQFLCQFVLVCYYQKHIKENKFKSLFIMCQTVTFRHVRVLFVLRQRWIGCHSFQKHEMRQYKYFAFLLFIEKVNKRTKGQHCSEVQLIITNSKSYNHYTVREAAKKFFHKWSDHLGLFLFQFLALKKSFSLVARPLPF